ncbi:MAG: BlaI/MecI/CopY family transcriptional regulator [Oscillospiraceae bacterium]|nr:BlaI/MecI/CopY family transcriptional regulator [Clostridiales bacterium]MBS1433862.1 BlaI/MecI/CopY family transcriptional regulator [Oscillospiraceae bacterium]
METPKIFDSELRFCEILWEHQPVRSSELAHLCTEKLGWKKSTTYTVIKRLTERGVVQTEDAVVTALVSRDQVQRAESRAFVERNFSGSLPGFLNAFVGGRGLSAEEADELRRMIADLEEKNHD